MRFPPIPISQIPDVLQCASPYNTPMARHAAVVVLSIYAFAGSCQAGEVSGHVIGPNSKPIKGAHVYALAVSSPAPGRFPDVLTDSKGAFFLRNVHSGENEIHAYAPEMGYADSLFAVFQTAPVPTVTLKDGETVQGITVQLGPKPGTLSGSVIDAKNRNPLPLSSLTIRWADRPEYSVQSSINQDGTFTFKVPSHPLAITVSCEGYRPWTSNQITISSGEIYTLAVAMRQ